MGRVGSDRMRDLHAESKATDMLSVETNLFDFIRHHV